MKIYIILIGSDRSPRRGNEHVFVHVIFKGGLKIELKRSKNSARELKRECTKRVHTESAHRECTQRALLLGEN